MCRSSNVLGKVVFGRLVVSRLILVDVWGQSVRHHVRRGPVHRLREGQRKKREKETRNKASVNVFKGRCIRKVVLCVLSIC